MSYIQSVVSTQSGLELPYIEQGRSDGTPVIFLHGITDSHRSWEPVFANLDLDIRAIALTQRGHGDASKPSEGYYSSDLARDLAEAMDALQFPSAIIVGHSMGSFAAQRFAIDYPERTEGLVLIGSFATCADNEGIKQFVGKSIDNLSDPVPYEFAVGFQRSKVYKAVDDGFFDQAVAESLKAPARVWKAAANSMIETNHRPLLEKIKARTLLIWGDQDSYFSIDEQKRLLGGIHGAQLTVYEGSGHAPNWETPERTANDIQNFVKTLARDRSKVASEGR